MYVCFGENSWMLVQCQNLIPLPKMPWNLPLLIMGELHILSNMTGTLLPVNKDIRDFSFSQGSLITSHSEKRFSPVFKRPHIYFFIEVFMRTTLSQTGPSSFPLLKMCTYTLSTCTRETRKHCL